MNAGGLKMQGPNLELCKPQSPRVRMAGKWAAEAPTEAKFTPGPGAYPTYGGVGQKPAPHMRRNPPSFSFGGARRGPATGKGASRVARAQTPGPGEYDLPSGSGRQSVSTHRSAPAASLSPRPVDRRASRGDDGGFACRADSFLSPRTAPNKPWSPRVSFGARLSPRDARGGDTPGPGRYVGPSHGSSIGRQLDSKYTSSPAVSLSGRTRLPGTAAAAKASSAGSEMTDSSIGRQKTSTQSNAPAFSFGERTQSAGLSARNATNPGPGYYG
jgi:hypothetical protein